MASSPIDAYRRQIERELQAGNATEHTHRPALKTLLESFATGITATNEPKRIACGAPDVIVTRKKVPLGHIETKDVGTNLDEMKRGKGPNGAQFIRYRDGLPNWILTDYLEFRWYVAGEERLTARLACLGIKGKLEPTAEGEQDLSLLLDAFLKQQAPTVGTAKELAQRMAGMTHLVRDLIIGAFEHEKEKGWLHNWLAAFREVLIPDLDEKRFADMFAQTLAYGLFAAKVHAGSGKPFSRELAAFNLPKTNPFLRKLFSEIAGVDMPEAIDWAVDEIVELLKHAAMEKILKDFGKGEGREDPVVHFYETFLAAYDPKMRELRGVYYTPEPVVSYIVRSVDHLLKTRFHRPKGLADENTLILDPATGTATFLYFVIREIYQKFQNQKGAWDGYVSAHLLNRIFGFELLMAPYAVAHLKLGLELQETGYSFTPDQRLGIYLTNTLEEAAKKSESLFAKWISDEANAAAEIKRDRKILVVLGNPPYSGISANRGKWITDLLQSYREVDGEPLGEKKVWLKNDYVKFIRFGQWRVERTGFGILAFITDHSYLDSPTFRGMREKLLKAFDETFILNLHGNQKRREQTPQGGKDVNVFDITQGVAISLFVRRQESKESKVYYADLWGLRETKYQNLRENTIASTKWQELSPHAPSFHLVPFSEKASIEYEKGTPIREIFPVGSNGVQTSRDSLVVAFDSDTIEKRMKDMLDERISDGELRIRFFGEKSVADYKPGDTREWSLPKARVSLEKDKKWKDGIAPYLYRPFDTRFLFYRDYMVDWPRRDVMENLVSENMALCVGRAGLVTSGGWNLAFCTQQVCDHNVFYRGSSLNLPLYIYPKEVKKGLFVKDGERQANISEKFIREIAGKLKLTCKDDGSGDLKKTFGPEDIYHYVYAILYSPAYRERYAEFLRNDFPRIPVAPDRKLFAALAGFGRQLTAIHFMYSPELDELVTEFPKKGSNLVEKVTFLPEKERLWINPKQFFDGVSEDVWEFQTGGYQVCEKWLKDRRGRTLSYDDTTHYQKIIVALKMTIRLMEEIDAAIPKWPIE